MRTSRHFTFLMLPIFLICLDAGPASAGPDKKSDRCNFFCAPDNYCGFGIVEVDKDVGLAMNDAVKKARVELGANIKVWVKSRLTDVIQLRQDKKGYSQESIEQVTEQYVDMGLEGVELKRVIDDSNRRVCVFATLSKKAYQDQVMRDINAKIKRIEEFYKKAQLMLARGEVMISIQSLISALEWMQKDFGDLPVKGMADDVETDMHAAVRTRLDQILGRISLQPLEKSIPFSANGRPKGQIVFKVSYNGEAGDVPVSNAPLVFTLARGQGNIQEKAVTTRLGIAEVLVTRLEPGQGDIVIQARLVIPGIEEKWSRVQIPHADVELYKVKAVAVVVMPEGYMGGIEDKVKAMLTGMKVEMVETARAGSVPPSDADYTKLQDAGADYLVSIVIKADASQPSPADLAFGHGSATFVIYNINSRNPVSSGTVDGEKGYGVNVSAAKSKALANLKGALVKQLEEALKRVMKSG